MATTATYFTKANDNNSSRDKMTSFRTFVRIFLHFVANWNHASGEYKFDIILIIYLCYWTREKLNRIRHGPAHKVYIINAPCFWIYTCMVGFFFTNNTENSITKTVQLTICRIIYICSIVFIKVVIYRRKNRFNV